MGASHLGWHGQTCLPVLDDFTGKLVLARAARASFCHLVGDALPHQLRDGGALVPCIHLSYNTYFIHGEATVVSPDFSTKQEN